MRSKASQFIEQLKLISRKHRAGIPKIEIFNLGKEFTSMPVPEVVKLLRNPDHDFRVGAVSILDWKARSKKTSETERREIYEAYIENHKWIDDWGLVDRAAPYVVGGYLYDKDRMPLYELAKSKNPMERRTAIVSTYFFIRQNEIDDTFQIAEILVMDDDEYVQKAVGSWIREAGKRDQGRLRAFLDKYAASMPRTTLRYAIEQLDGSRRQKYLNARSDASRQHP
jgi:3-methyladenine DNA glycosylase AlkD